MAEQNGRTEMQEMDALRNTWSWSKRWSANRKKRCNVRRVRKAEPGSKGKRTERRPFNSGVEIESKQVHRKVVYGERRDLNNRERKSSIHK